MKQINLLMSGEGEPMQAWFDDIPAREEVIQYNNDLPELNAELRSNHHDTVKPAYLLSVAIQDSTTLPYIAVYCHNGESVKVKPGLDLKILIDELEATLPLTHSETEDDVKIFDVQGNEVYRYHPGA
jgi:hypothetical protein